MQKAIWSKLNAEDSKVKDSKLSTFIGEWLPTFIMTFVNYFIPWVLSFISRLEQWDFASEELTSELWKNYYTSALNVIFFMVIHLFKMRSQPKYKKGDNILYNCKEDDLIDNFLKLLMSEFILRYIFYFYWIVHHNLKSWCFKSYSAVQDFELADELVWFLAIETLLWSLFVIYPITAFMSVVLMYVHCRYLVYRLKYQKRQPYNASNDMSTGSVMIVYLNITFYIVCSFYSFILFVPIARYNFWNINSEREDKSRNCGPFTSNNDLSPI